MLIFSYYIGISLAWERLILYLVEIRKFLLKRKSLELNKDHYIFGNTEGGKILNLSQGIKNVFSRLKTENMDLK